MDSESQPRATESRNEKGRKNRGRQDAGGSVAAPAKEVGRGASADAVAGRPPHVSVTDKVIENAKK